MTEKTKEQIKNGTILKLCPSPKRLVREILRILQSTTDPHMRLNSFKSLQSLSSDYAVARELVKEDGLTIIVDNASSDSVTAQVSF